MSTLSLAALYKLHAGQHFVVAAPGPSLGALPAADRVIAVNLAIETTPADYWLVIDRPDRIPEPDRRQRFLAAPQGAPMLLPTTSVGAWDRDAYVYALGIPPHDRTYPFAATSRDGFPILPQFRGCGMTAAAAAIYMGARRVTLCGVDHTGAKAPGCRSERDSLVEMWREFAAVAKRQGVTMAQANPESPIQFTAGS